MHLWGKFARLTPVILSLRNMRTRWVRTLLTGLGIMLGVSVILAIAVTNDSTLKSIRGVFDEASGKSSLLVQSSSADGGGFDQSIAARVRSLDGVVRVAPSVQGTTVLARDAKNWKIAFGLGGLSAGNTLLIYGVDPAFDRDVRQYDFVAGHWMADQAYEAVVTETYARDKALKVGEDLVILIPNGQERLRIVGVVKRTGAGLLNDGVVAFVPLTVAQDLFNRGSDVDALDVMVAPDIANDVHQLETLKDQLTARLGHAYSVSYPASRGELVTQMLSAYQKGLAFFSVVAIFVGAFLIYNAFSMTVLERTRELGLLRALGMTQAQVLELVLTEAFSLAVLGSAVGVGFGLILARGLIWMLGGVVATDVNVLSIPMQGLLQSLLVGGLVTMGSALLPALQAARTSPLEALRVQGRAGSHRSQRLLWFSGAGLILTAWAALYWIPWRPEVSFLIGQGAILILLFGATLIVPAVVESAERLARPIARLFFGNEGMLGSNNVRRSPGRTALTVASLMVGLAMVIANTSLATAFTNDITSWVATALGGDLIVRAPLPMREQFERQLAAVPGVGSLTKIRYFGAKVAPSVAARADTAGSDVIYYAGIDPVTYRTVGQFQFASNQGDAEANWARFKQGDALFVSTVVADRYHLKQGDTLRLITRRGEHDFYVAALAVDFTGQGYIVTGTWDDMRRWFSKTGVDRFTLSVAPGYTVAQTQKNIEDRYKASRNLSVETTEEFKHKVLTLSQQSFRLFDVLGVIGMVVAALGVINTLMMNVLERQREIGGLRSLGLTRSQTTKMVLAEAATLGGIGGAFGLGFGYILSQIFVLALNQLAGYDLKYVFNPSPFISGVFIAFGVSQLAALYPAWKAAGVNIVEAIKHE
jgi:putative ABC transport system permease protein